MSECIFCKIVEGEIPAKSVYEDDEVLAFLDVNPLTPGHTLVIPKVHVERIAERDAATAAGYFEQVPRIVDAVQAGVDADGATLAWNDGRAAGQEVPHAHLHIVPRRDGDAHGPIHALFGGQEDLPEGEMDEIQQAIQEGMK